MSLRKETSSRLPMGGGTGDRANRGAVAQAALGEVPFIIESDGDGNGDFKLVTGDKPPVSKSRRAAGRLYQGDPAGELVVEVVGATDGTGIAEREIRDTERVRPFTMAAPQRRKKRSMPVTVVPISRLHTPRPKPSEMGN